MPHTTSDMLPLHESHGHTLTLRVSAVPRTRRYLVFVADVMLLAVCLDTVESRELEPKGKSAALRARCGMFAAFLADASRSVRLPSVVV